MQYHFTASHINVKNVFHSDTGEVHHTALYSTSVLNYSRF